MYIYVGIYIFGNLRLILKFDDFLMWYMYLFLYMSFCDFGLDGYYCI